MSSYSNFGATLAGLIVEEVSGVPYNDYIQKYIFDPLDMKYSTVVEPLPESFIPNQVVGYTSENGSFIPGTPTFEGGFRPASTGYSISSRHGALYDCPSAEREIW